MQPYILWQWTSDLATAEPATQGSSACALIMSQHTQLDGSPNELMLEAGVSCRYTQSLTAQGRAALASRFGSWAAMQQAVRAARAQLRRQNVNDST